VSRDFGGRPVLLQRSRRAREDRPSSSSSGPRRRNREPSRPGPKASEIPHPRQLHRLSAHRDGKRRRSPPPAETPRRCARACPRGLKGVRLIICDAHRVLTTAIVVVCAGATWQRSAGSIHAPSRKVSNGHAERQAALAIRTTRQRRVGSAPLDGPVRQARRRGVRVRTSRGNR
jgi:hypothetical protein